MKIFPKSFFVAFALLLVLNLASFGQQNLDLRPIPYPDTFPPETNPLDPRVTIVGDGTTASPRDMTFLDNGYKDSYRVIRERFLETTPGESEVSRSKVAWLRTQSQLIAGVYRDVAIDGKLSTKTTYYGLKPNGLRNGTVQELFKEYELEDEFDNPVLGTVLVVQQDFINADGRVDYPDGTMGNSSLMVIKSTSPSRVNPVMPVTRLQVIFKFSFDVESWTLDRRINGVDGDSHFFSVEGSDWFLEGEEEMQDQIISALPVHVPPLPLIWAPWPMPYFNGVMFFDASAFNHSHSICMWLPTGNEVDASFGYVTGYYAFRQPIRTWGRGTSLCLR